MEKWIFEKIADFIDKIPIPLLKFRQDVMVPSLEYVEMGLRLACSSK